MDEMTPLYKSTICNMLSLVAMCIGEPKDSLSKTLLYLESQLRQMIRDKELIEHCLSVVAGQLIAKGLK